MAKVEKQNPRPNEIDDSINKKAQSIKREVHIQAIKDPVFNNLVINLDHAKNNVLKASKETYKYIKKNKVDKKMKAAFDAGLDTFAFFATKLINDKKRKKGE